MHWQSTTDYAEMSGLAADRVYRAVADGCSGGRRFNLGLATGNTMIGLYRHLADQLNRMPVDLTNLHTYNLDEYVGPDGRVIPARHPLSYHSYMKTHFFDALDPALGFAHAHCHFPDAVCPDAFDDELTRGGGLDFQLLGIGFNGHIAFNEPMSSTEISQSEFGDLPTRVVSLEELTIQTNSRLTAGNDEALVPHHAVTMGMKQILAAREILLLACFPEQAAPLARMLGGEITPELPASYLLRHPDATLLYTADTVDLDL